MRIEIELEGARHTIHCRQFGQKGRDQPTLFHLHGGWGYSIYPFDVQIEALEASCRILIPDRIGYGRSGRREAPLSLDFHRQAAHETLAVMDALGLERAWLWGHSDGACIAAWIGLLAPERCRALVLEALHYERAKPRSVDFFRAMEVAPWSLGARVAEVMAAEHGDDSWQELMRLGGEVWRRIRETPHSHEDLFDGRLGELRTPTLVLHGARDPRTEPGELEAAKACLPGAELKVLEEGRHCPHAEAEVQGEATAAAVDFLTRHGLSAGGA